jgi:hypothetical protein
MPEIRNKGKRRRFVLVFLLVAAGLILNSDAPSRSLSAHAGDIADRLNAIALEELAATAAGRRSTFPCDEFADLADMYKGIAHPTPEDVARR